MDATFTKRLSLILAIIVCHAETHGSVPNADEIVELETFVTTGDASESILPTTMKSLAVFGQDMSIIDTPRAMSTITQGQLQDKNVLRVEDLDRFVSGAFSAPIFGNIGVPFMRGDLGEIYQNGQRKAYNRNSFPVSFNGVEAVDAVKGAAPAVFGYGNATGGYLNLTTKRPYEETQQGMVKFTAGSWDYYRWQADVGGPINEKWGYRMSYEGLDSGSFYRLAENKSQSLYAAVAYKASDSVDFLLTAEYLDADFTEIPGTNRPTQDLIDKGLYITGESISTGGSFFGNTFTPTGVVPIDGSQILLAPGDDAYAKVFNSQAITTIKLEEGQVVSRTYFESVEAERGSSYYFYSYLPESYTFEQRLEYARDFDLFGLRHQTLSGASYRYEYRKSYVDFLNEYFNAFDLTKDPDTFRLPTNQLFAVLPVPGTGGYAVPGGAYPRNDGTNRLTTSLSATLNSTLHNGGFFVQDFIQFNKHWALLVSGRLDLLDIHTIDPLPRPGFTAIEAENAMGIWSGNVSLTYKPKANATLYFTLNESAAVESSSSSGGFGMTGNRIPNEALENSSQLAEWGGKVSLLDNTLFAGVANYYQKRNRTSPRSGLPDEIEIWGIEWDILYQPTASFNAGLIGTYAEAHYIDGPVAGTPATRAPFSPDSPSNTFPIIPTADYRLPGLPHWVVNAFASYTLPVGLGASAALKWQSEMNLDIDGYVVIPNQVTLDLALFYRYKQFEVRLELLNATDEFNWRPTSTPFAGADLVTRELPRHFRLTGVVRW